MVVTFPVLVGEDFYTNLLAQHYGLGMPRYRGSPMLGGSFWSSILGFAKGLAARAAPHLSSLANQAKPHVRGLATRAIGSAIDGAVDKVTSKLQDLQDGKGRRRGIKGHKVTKVSRKVVSKRKGKKRISKTTKKKTTRVLLPDKF